MSSWSLNQQRAANKSSMTTHIGSYHQGGAAANIPQTGRHQMQQQGRGYLRMAPAVDGVPISSSPGGHSQQQPPLGMMKSRSMENHNTTRKSHDSDVSYDQQMTKPGAVPVGGSSGTMPRSRSNNVHQLGTSSAHGGTVQGYPYARNRQRPVGDGYSLNSEGRRRIHGSPSVATNNSTVTSNTLTAVPGAIAMSGHPEGGMQHMRGNGGDVSGGDGTYMIRSSHNNADVGNANLGLTLTATTSPPPPSIQSLASTRNSDDSSLPVAETVVSSASTNSREAREAFLANRESDIATRIANTLREEVQNQVRQQLEYQQQQQQDPPDRIGNHDNDDDVYL